LGETWVSREPVARVHRGSRQGESSAFKSGHAVSALRGAGGNPLGGPSGAKERARFRGPSLIHELLECLWQFLVAVTVAAIASAAVVVAMAVVGSASAVAVVTFTVMAVFALVAVALVILAAAIAVVAFAVLVEAGAASVVASQAEVLAAHPRQRAAGAEAEECDCEDRRQT